MNFIKKYFRDERKTSVDVAVAWEVRWRSRYNEYLGTRPEIRVFIDKEQAENFASALRDAFSLIKHTSGNEVTVCKQEV